MDRNNNGTSTCELCGATIDLNSTTGWMETDTGDVCAQCVVDAEGVEAPAEPEVNYYDLAGSQAARINFDRMVQRYAGECLSPLSNEDILAIDPDDYALTAWDVSPVETSDPDEAKARFLSEFSAAVRAKQHEIQEQPDAEE